MQSHYITASRHCITPPHYTTASHHRITSLHYTIALRHCITPLRHNTRSTRSTAYTLGRHYNPISFHNRAARHSLATLQPLNVPHQCRAAPLGNTLPLFRRRNIRIDPVMNKPGDTFGTLGRRFKPTSFPNRAARHSRATYSPKVFPNSAMRHSRATLQPLNVPQQCHATLSGDITAPKRSTTVLRDTPGNALPLFRRWRVRIDPVSNKLGDTFSTLGRHYSP